MRQRKGPLQGQRAPRVQQSAEAPAEAPPVKSAEAILERIFAPTPKASPAEQAERALRRPKQLI